MRLRLGLFVALAEDGDICGEDAFLIIADLRVNPPDVDRPADHIEEGHAGQEEEENRESEEYYGSDEEVVSGDRAGVGHVGVEGILR
eukprot:CAMPEP_0170488338 /NCGR_PEP_ID=MMETSP0208-20121228/6921_1 /TAXON_ID=197538 /ORGANISM="Strombidium inclinatum, Strain S3" /LENGTH=86 /DNA_ID=CAMNT_0010762881 /DNA_START=192 /DNA_END=452 /DNA_ORIENTATION=+